MSSTKSKYLKTLGFFNHFAPSLGIIPESQNEYNDEIIHRRKNTAVSQSFTKDEVRDLIMNAVKNNNLQQLKELLEQYDTYEIDSLGTNGWTALHYACLNGHSGIAHELVTTYKANVNLQNVDGWTPLHLASYKGYADIVMLLLSNPNTDINMNVPSIGTPLHCACKKNNLQVVSILLHKANFKYVCNFKILA